jgi:hypothetical protein
LNDSRLYLRDVNTEQPEKELAKLDAWVSALRWRDKLPLALSLGLIVLIPVALQERIVKEWTFQPPAEWSLQPPELPIIKPIHTPLPHPKQNGIATVWVDLKPDGTVWHLRNRQYVPGFEPSHPQNHVLEDAAAAMVKQWRFDVGGVSAPYEIRFEFVFIGGHTTASWEYERPLRRQRASL